MFGCALGAYKCLLPISLPTRKTKEEEFSIQNDRLKALVYVLVMHVYVCVDVHGSRQNICTKSGKQSFAASERETRNYKKSK